MSLQQRVAEWRERESFVWRSLGTAVKFVVEFLVFFLLLGTPVALATIYLPGLSFAVRVEPWTFWHIVLPFAVSFTGAAWCWSV